jgi:molybdate transport system substrate-binding protein
MEPGGQTVRRLAYLGTFLLALVHPALAQEITLAAAADLQFAMQEVVGSFQKQTGKRVNVVYGSSGNFFEQIRSGAPFDLFFSANLDYAKKLEAAGLAEPGTLYPYATGKIVLWVPSASKVNLQEGLRAVLDPTISKLAIANPQHAPYGQAAEAALKKENLYARVSDKLVLGENISQTASFVLSGAADAGILALSLALSPNMKDKGRYVEVPPADYPPIEQGCVVLAKSRSKADAREFLEFVKSTEAREILQKYGFGVK